MTALLRPQDALARYFSDRLPGRPTDGGVRPTQDQPRADAGALRLKGFWDLAGADEGRKESLVEGLVPTPGLVLLTGAPKSFKTLAALQIGVAVSSAGVPEVMGSSVHHGPVIFVEEEGDESEIRRQGRRMAGALAASAADFSFAFFSGLRIDTAGGIQQLEDAIREREPALMVLDPLSFLHDRDENAASEMAPLMRDLATLANGFRMCILIVHHNNKLGQSHGLSLNKVRGSGAITAAASSILVFERRGSRDVVTLTGTFRYDPPTKREFMLDPDSLLLVPSDDTPKAQAKISAAIMEYTREHDRPVTVAEMEKVTGKSKNWTRDCLDQLVAAGALLKDTTGREHCWSLAQGPESAYPGD